jgi:chemotaxis protein CheZ
MKANDPVKEFSAERQLRLQQINGSSGGDGHDTLALLDAIDELRAEVVALREAQQQSDSASVDLEPWEKDSLEARIEIAQMVRVIGKAKLEISAIKHPMAEDDRMQLAANELDAIVLATETSTHDILTASEEIEQATRKIANIHPDDEDVANLVEQIANEIIKIFEACNFQDITGQRVTKVVKTLRFIEEKILALINIWGIEAFADLPMPEGPSVDEDGTTLSGPQLDNQGITQDEINALFD